MITNKKDLIIKLLRLRYDANLTQPAVAKKVGVSQATLCAFECNKHFPKLETIEQIANCYGYELKVTYELQKIHDPEAWKKAQ